ncbi:MAG: GNAT family N-acetyltransferase [Acidimicrobiales bacterium]
MDRRPDGIHIVDIALLPGLRGQGYGTRLIGTILAEADRAGLRSGPSSSGRTRPAGSTTGSASPRLAPVLDSGDPHPPPASPGVPVTGR